MEEIRIRDRDNIIESSKSKGNKKKKKNKEPSPSRLSTQCFVSATTEIPVCVSDFQSGFP
jgi:hypothetical protein